MPAMGEDLGCCRFLSNFEWFPPRLEMRWQDGYGMIFAGSCPETSGVPAFNFFSFVYSARLAVSFAGFTHAKSAGKKTVREDREVGTWFCADARWRILVSGLGAG